MELDTLKVCLKNSARQHFKEIIQLACPQHTQINMALGIVTDGVEDMKAMISAKRDEEHALETAIDTLTSIIRDCVDDTQTIDEQAQTIRILRENIHTMQKTIDDLNTKIMTASEPIDFCKLWRAAHNSRSFLEKLSTGVGCERSPVTHLIDR